MINNPIASDTPVTYAFTRSCGWVSECRCLSLPCATIVEYCIYQLLRKILQRSLTLFWLQITVSSGLSYEIPHSQVLQTVSISLSVCLSVCLSLSLSLSLSLCVYGYVCLCVCAHVFNLYRERKFSGISLINLNCDITLHKLGVIDPEILLKELSRRI